MNNENKKEIKIYLINLKRAINVRDFYRKELINDLKLKENKDLIKKNIYLIKYWNYEINLWNKAIDSILN